MKKKQDADFELQYYPTNVSDEHPSPQPHHIEDMSLMAEQPEIEITSSAPVVFSQQTEDPFPVSPTVNFPDPARHVFIIQYFVGMSYVFSAIWSLITKGFLLISIMDAIMFGVALFLSVAGGAAMGTSIVFFSWTPIPTNAWVKLLGFLPYNLFWIYITCMVLLSMLLVMILFGISYLIISPCVDQSTKRLSYLTERKMNGLYVNFISGKKGESVEDEDEDVICCCIPNVFAHPEKFVIGLIWGFIQKQARKFVDRVVQVIIRYFSSVLTVIIANAITMVIGFSIPGIGIGVQLWVALHSAAFQIAVLGLEVIMVDRKKYNYFESLLTIINNIALVMGLGTGLFLLLLTPLVIIAYPVIIMSTTQLFVHLDANNRTAKKDKYLSILGCVNLRLVSCGEGICGSIIKVSRR